MTVLQILRPDRFRKTAMLMLALSGAALTACSSPSGPGNDGGVSGQARELLGIWVSDDNPAERLVFEFLTHTTGLCPHYFASSPRRWELCLPPSPT